MFLTLALLRKGIPGKQWIGKYRRSRAVIWQMRHNVIKRLEQEAENEHWISRPFMMQEQEQGHAAQRHEWMWQQIKAAHQAKFPELKYIAD
ncbi:ribosomal protein 63, mitochondrial-like [Carassius gibelio]|uniref:ribosomal protein 63, mitochondrial-like n=1 Tax=Carassius gibelio TaxID=101364 RepID=UPI00227994B3|nr:ribosomal protein 63, mitochondrial-like [Carassius gibelio]